VVPSGLVAVLLPFVPSYATDFFLQLFHSFGGTVLYYVWIIPLTVSFALFVAAAALILLGLLF
jgi:hypothetical protein